MVALVVLGHIKLFLPLYTIHICMFMTSKQSQAKVVRLVIALLMTVVREETITWGGF